MLQRIQTIYLVLAFASSILVLFFPIFNISFVSVEGSDLLLSTFGAYGAQGDTVESVPLYLVFILTAMLSLTAIFLYKNRKKQLLVCRLNLLLHILIAISFMLVYFFGFDFIETQYSNLSDVATKVHVNGGVGYYLLFVGIPFVLLAIRGIKADEALLKSLDRLR